MTLARRLASWIAFEAGRFALGIRRSSSDVSPRDWAQAMAALVSTQGPEKVEYRQALERVGLVYSCITTISQTLAAIPLCFYRVKGEDYTKLQPGDHEAVALWDRPNPRMTGYDLVEILQQSKDTWGNAYLYKERGTGGKGPVRELWPVFPEIVNIIMKPDRTVDHYELHLQGTLYKIPPQDMIHFSNHHPNFGAIGLSPLSAARIAYTTRHNAGRWGEEFYTKGAQVSGFWETEDPLPEQEFVRLLEQLKKRGQGGRNMFDPIITPQGLKWTRSGMTMSEMQFVESNTITREDILAVFKVPPAIVGIFDNRGALSDAGVRVQERLFYEHCLMPRARALSDRLQRFYLGEWAADGLEVEFNFEGVHALQSIMLETAKMLQEATGGPVMTRAEGRELLELPPLDDEGVEELLVPNLMTPASDVGADAAGTTTPPPKPPADQKPPEPEPLAHPLFRRRAAATSRDVPASGRQARARRNANLIRVHEKRTAAGIVRLLRRQRARVKKAVLAEYGHIHRIPHVNRVFARSLNLDDLLRDEGADLDLMRRLIEAIVAEQGERATQQAAEEVAFDLQARNVQEYLATKPKKGLAYINDTTKTHLRAAIAAEVDKGGSIGDMVQAVIKAVDEVYALRISQALMIARTETAGAFNFATMEGWDQTGEVEGKVWLTAEDDRVRDSHAEADGQEVPLDQPFDVGGSQMDYPGDPSGPPEEVINCRCSMDAVLMKRSARANGNGKTKAKLRMFAGKK